MCPSTRNKTGSPPLRPLPGTGVGNHWNIIHRLTVKGVVRTTTLSVRFRYTQPPANPSGVRLCSGHITIIRVLVSSATCRDCGRHQSHQIISPVRCGSEHLENNINRIAVHNALVHMSSLSLLAMIANFQHHARA